MGNKICLTKIFTVLTLIIAIHACKAPTDELNNTRESLHSAAFEIAKIKLDYEIEMSKVINLKTTGKDKREKTLKRKLRWDESYSVNTLNGEKIIVPFSLEDELFFMDRYGNRSSYSSSTFFLVSKKGNKNDFELATYISDVPDDPTKITRYWSGQIVIENAQGDFKAAYKVENGTIVAEGFNDISNGRISYMDCRQVEYWSCAWVPSIGYYAPCVYMYTAIFCWGTVPPATGTSSNGYVQLVAGQPTTGSSGGSSGSSSIYGNMVDRVTAITKFSNFTTGQKVYLNDVLDDMITRSCIFRSLYMNIVSRNVKVSWFMDPNMSNAGTYNPQNKRITFVNQNQINRDVLREEIFHAFQDAYYAGGTYQFFPNGQLNIEFEAKVMANMTDFADPAGFVQAVSSPAYYNWLASMTNYGSKFPNTSNFNYAQYFSFMGDFDAQSPYAGNINYNLNPEAMFEVISTSGCPK